MKLRIIIIIMLSLSFISCGKSIKKTFEQDVEEHFEPSAHTEQILTLEQIGHLPEPVQGYLIRCGFVGHEMVSNAQVIWSESFIKMKPDSKWLKLNTKQYNSVKTPFRIAYMKANLLGVVPFEGRDLYASGQGHMYGKIANMIKIFDEKTPEISQAALVTILAEALLVPGYAISDYITWEAIDKNSAKATMSYQGSEASGIFYFNQHNEMIRFESQQRYYMDPELGFVLRHFIASVEDYQKQGDLYIPTAMVATWQLPEGEYNYWKGIIKEVRYNIGNR